jgi:hypothetical protein
MVWLEQQGKKPLGNGVKEAKFQSRVGYTDNTTGQDKHLCWILEIIE